MSVDAGMYLNLVSPNGPETILDALLASKWSGGKEGWWCVPLDEDPSEWCFVAGGTMQYIKALFRAKMEANQPFGVRLWWEGAEVGGEFLVFPNCEVTFSPSVNRVTQGERVTDVSWYLARLLPVFDQENGMRLDSWTWRETS